jgi:hypothetical protein
MVDVETRRIQLARPKSWHFESYGSLRHGGARGMVHVDEARRRDGEV